MQGKFSQGVSENGQRFDSIGELFDEARKRTDEQQKNPPAEEKKGLEFMALRLNVVQKRRELQILKYITPAEYYMLEEIELGTIGGQNGKSTICSAAEFNLDDLAKKLGILKNKVYVHLKSLETKGLITRKATRYKGAEIIGLSPEVFGQVLIDKYHEMEKRKHLRMAVDNTKPSVDNSRNGVGNFSGEIPQKDSPDPKKGPYNSPKRIEPRPIKDQLPPQSHEIIEEKTPLDSSRVILESSRGSTGESFTLVEKGPGTEKPKPYAEITEAPIDIESLDPRWRRFASRGTVQ